MNTMNNNLPKFKLGRTVATPGAISVLADSGEDASLFLSRHVTGDWGDVGEQDKQSNDDAIANEGDLEQMGRVLSVYRTSKGEKIWIITEADRSSTCVLLPDEY